MRQLLPTLLLLTVATACGTSDSGPPTPGSQSLVTPETMRLRLRDLVLALSSAIDNSGREIAAQTDDFPLKRLSVLYRIRATTAARQTLTLRDPVAGFFDLWTLCIQFEEFLCEGDGRVLFEEQQQMALDAVAEMVRRIDETAQRTFPKEAYDRARQDVYRFADEHPIKGRFVRQALQPSEVPVEDKGGTFTWLPSLSLNLFGNVGEGISEGAAAINAFGEVADRFTDVVDFLPQQVGWQLELFLYDLEESKPVEEISGGVQRIGAAAEGVAAIGERLPTRVRLELEEALEAIDPKLAQVRATLADVETASVSLDRFGTTFDQTADSIRMMADQLDRTLQVFQKTYILLDGDPNVPPPPRDPNEPRGHPFNVVEFDLAAQSVTAMAGELQQTLERFEGLVASDRLDGRIAEVETSARNTATSLIWMAAGALAAVLALFFLLKVLFRLLERRIGARPG